jgi:hypothetical protein
MPPIRIPGTDRIIFVNSHIGDIEINLKDYPEIEDSIKYEDVKVIGNWTDYSGSGKKNSQEVMLAGVEDSSPETLLGQIEQSDLNLTDRGNESSITRQRPRIIYKEVK